MSFQSNIILVALELSNSIWLVGTRLPGAQKSRMHRVTAGDTANLLGHLSALQTRHQAMSKCAAPIACCFEAGRDGFGLHRLLTANNIPTYVVEPTSILVNRRAKRAKTDRINAEGLLRVLGAYLGGDTQICSMVRVPTPDEEDGKRIRWQLGQVSADSGQRLVRQAVCGVGPQLLHRHRARHVDLVVADYAWNTLTRGSLWPRDRRAEYRDPYRPRYSGREVLRGLGERQGLQERGRESCGNKETH